VDFATQIKPTVTLRSFACVVLVPYAVFHVAAVLHAVFHGVFHGLRAMLGAPKSLVYRLQQLGARAALHGITGTHGIRVL
jgi:hypothetical protein